MQVMDICEIKSANQRSEIIFLANELFDKYIDICYKQRKRENGRWTDLGIDEVFTFYILGLLLSMGVYEIHGPCLL